MDALTAMKQALEALDSISKNTCCGSCQEAARVATKPLSALRVAIKDLESVEPVAWMNKNWLNDMVATEDAFERSKVDAPMWIPLYAQPTTC